MKIVYFNYLYDLYGVSIGSTIKAKELLTELSQCGHDVQIYWRKKQPAGSGNNSKVGLKQKIKNMLLKHVHDPKHFLLHNLKYIPEEFKILSREKPDLIISRLDLYVFSALLLAKIKKIPLIIEADAPCVYESKNFHSQYWGVSRLAEKVERMNLLNSDTNFCVSNKLYDYFTSQGVPEEKMHVITNGADTQRFRPLESSTEVRDKYNLQGKTVIGFVGSFHYWHGVDNLVNVIKGSIDTNKDTAFVLVGQGGPMKSTLEKYIQENQLQDRVILTGYISYEDIPKYISAMDIVLAPYPNLDFFYYSPVKVYEYMACAKPVVTTAIGQIAEIITDKENGLLCRPDNLKDILDNVRTLVENPELRERIGNNARRTIEANYSWHQKAMELSALCDQVLNAHQNKHNNC